MRALTLVIIIACFVIRGCIFGFWLLFELKVFHFSIDNCIIGLDFFDALFLYFGLFVA